MCLEECLASITKCSDILIGLHRTASDVLPIDSYINECLKSYIDVVQNDHFKMKIINNDIIAYVDDVPICKITPPDFKGFTEEWYTERGVTKWSILGIYIGFLELAYNIDGKRLISLILAKY